MKISAFSAPAGIDDFGAIPNQHAAWSEFLGFVFDHEVKKIIEEYQKELGKKVTPQFYNPLRGNGATDKPVTQQRPWQGFPNVNLIKYGNLAYELTDLTAVNPLPTTVIGFTKEGIEVAASYRPQDEYLEWYVERDEKTGKIIKITFTCEAPEYWSAFANGYPSMFYIDQGFSPTTGAAGSLKNAHAMYETLLGQKVSPEDLIFEDDIYNAPTSEKDRSIVFKKGEYNPFNIWNTQKGAIHLTHPANTLGAEVNLAARAAVRRTSDGGTEPADAVHMICCSAYGAASRNSDPAIGFFVNTFARSDSYVTLLDPVALYMTSFNAAAFAAPNGDDVSQFFTVIRPKTQLADGYTRWLRAEFTVPAGRGYVVGDITKNKLPITSGGMVAAEITMMLVGAVDGKGTIHVDPLGCPYKGCKSLSNPRLFQEQPINHPCQALGDFVELDALQHSSTTPKFSALVAAPKSWAYRRRGRY